jgi:hypothetical protein
MKYVVLLTKKGKQITITERLYKQSEKTVYLGTKLLHAGTAKSCADFIAGGAKDEPKEDLFTQEDFDTLKEKMSAEGFKKTQLTAHDKKVLKALEAQGGADE